MPSQPNEPRMNATLSTRNPWPIAIVAFFALFISGIVIFVVFASRHPMELVRADYYAEEIEYQKQLDRLNRTQAVGTQVAIRYDAARASVSIALPAAPAGPLSGWVHFYRPSDATLDQTVPLIVNAEGAQQISAARLRPGFWKVRVQWTMNEKEYFFDQPIVIGPTTL